MSYTYKRINLNEKTQIGEKYKEKTTAELEKEKVCGYKKNFIKHRINPLRWITFVRGSNWANKIEKKKLWIKKNRN